ncbi:MFS transporter [Alkalihalobacterium chitinilyticum]|uniref:MFS transporter n=1 Tax=Alkalihalobacterium chitinilyticum TaxID=2980103 RepID=A0ABT5VEP9_9BACI|nr:MFS transporter [Alkalihalobacterium chitinilyticum]MDE5413936.1 MFS transporter [Alkalihalobacterium chitinilyticum]
MKKETSTTVVIYIIGLLPFVMVVGNSMFIPIIPDIQHALQLTAVEGGLVLTVFSIPAALMIPIIGLISDRIGRKKVILVSLLFIMIGSLLSAAAPVFLEGQSAFSMLLLGRFLQGVGAGGTAPMAMALAGDLFAGTDRSKALGTVEVFNSLGKVVSPIIGAFIAVYLWFATFFVYFFLALFAYFGMKIWIYESSKKTEPVGLREYRRSMSEIIMREFKWLIPIFFASGVGLLLLFGLMFFMSYYLEESYGIYGTMKGIYLALPLVFLTLFSYWTGKNMGDNKDHVKRFLLLGLSLLVSSFAFLIFYHGLISLLILISLASIGLGFFLPAANTAVTSSVGVNERGLVVSLYSMIRFLGVALGPITFSVLMYEPVELFFSSFFLIGISFVLLISSWTCIPILKDCVSRI